MNDFKVNVSSKDVEEQYQKMVDDYQPKKPKAAFDVKNYLNTKLKDGENGKTLKIRLLPFSPEGGTPFKKVWIHSIRVNKEVASSGWKMLPCPHKNEKNGPCPICEVSKSAREMQRNAVDASEKKKYGDVAFADQAKEAWVVRCIDRDNEADGVKFWLFNNSSKKQGIYDQMMSIYKTRHDDALEDGEDFNIFDLNNGHDLKVEVSRGSDGKLTYTVVDSVKRIPLTKNVEQGLSWINDTKTWEDVFTFKPYDYMKIIVQGGVPFFNKETNTYVAKDEAIKAVEQQKEDDLNKNLTPVNNEAFEIPSDLPKEPLVEDTDEDDDLPF